jgi:hypothetical protein
VLSTIQTVPVQKSEVQRFKVADEVLSRLAVVESDEYFKQGKCCLAAAVCLGVNDFKRAVQLLVRGGELFLAFIIARRFHNQALKDVVSLLTERLEKYFCMDLAIEVLKKYDGDPKKLSLTKRRIANTGLMKETGLETDMDQSVFSLIASNKLTDACKVATQRLGKIFQAPAH